MTSEWHNFFPNCNCVKGVFDTYPERVPWGCRQNPPSIFEDVIQIEFDPPPSPSHPIFDKFIFDKVLIMLASLLPLEFLTKIMKF